MTEWLWSLVPWGYQILLLIQGWRTGMGNTLFDLITQIGGEYGQMIITMLFYWCLNKALAPSLAYAMLGSGTINTWLKYVWQIPRPGTPALEGVLQRAGITGRVTPLAPEDLLTPSFPSGHTQGVTTTWGYLAYRLRRPWMWALTVGVILAVGFSRLYLAVHFPQDIIGGFLFGVLTLLAFVAIERYVAPRYLALSRAWRYGLAVGIPLLALLIYPIYEVTSTLGAIIGMGVGFLLERETLHFSVEGALWRRIARFFLGFAMMLAVLYGLKALFGLFDAGLGEWGRVALRTVRYAGLGFVGAWLAPWAFLKIGLCAAEKDATSPSLGA